MADVKERPSVEIIAPTLLKSVGIELKKTLNGISFRYSNSYIVSELEQLGFSIDVLRVQGGELPLPALAAHVDEQAAQEAYWGAQAEEARYIFQVLQDSYEFWHQSKYAECLVSLKDQGKSKPTIKDVDAYMARKYLKKIKVKKEKIRKAERKYRLLMNACYASIVTKGKMLQSLRNIIQGGNAKMPVIDTDVLNVKPDKIKAQSD